jgi:hypothetical protein
MDDGPTHPHRPKLDPLSVSEKKILEALYRLRDVPNSDAGFPRKLVGLLSGYTNVNGGSFTSGLKKFRERDSVRTLSGGNLTLMPGGAELYRSGGSNPPPPTIRSNDDFHRLMKGLIHSKPCCEIFDILVQRGTMTRKALASETGYRVCSGGSFGMNLKTLETLSIVEFPGQGLVRCTQPMFPYGYRTSRN